MTTFGKVKNIRRGKYISELQPSQSLHEVITAPMIGIFGKKDIDGANLSIGFSYLTEPFKMIEDEHRHTFDQFLLFVGGDPTNFTEFDAEVELGLGGETHLLTYPCWVFVPKGLSHCPLIVKRVTKPIIFIDVRLTREASVRTPRKKSR
jgi:hypothetical protein